jgi:hypothetical protein
MMMPRVRGVIACRNVRRGVGELDLFHQRRPPRHVGDHLVAGAEQHHDGVVERLFAAGGDDGLGGGVLDAVVVAIAADDRLLQLLGAGVGRVLGEVGVDRGLGRLADMLGRGEIRLPGAEIDDVDPLRLQRHGFGGNFHRG